VSLFTFVAAALCLASPVRAQTLDDVPSSLGGNLDPLARTARAVGMGRLTLVLPDVNNRLTMWDFAGNPTGVLEADSVSSIELRPGGWSTSSARDANDASGPFERQDFAGNRQRFGFEGWRRSGGTTVFGVIGEVAALRTDRPYDLEEERRTMISRPGGTIVLNGKMPWIATESMRYALRATLSSENLDEEFRFIRRNASGEYLNQTGAVVGPPNRFDPDENHTRTTGAGGALSYRLGPWLTLAAGADYRVEKLRSRNEGDRYLSEYEEDRPYGLGQFSAVGRVAALEYGADARLWSGSSNAIYVFTGSAGIGAIPITGRGDMYEREEEGNLLRGRLRWASGPLEIGASLTNGYRKIEITPPSASDGTSLNAYLRSLFYDPRADSIGLRDSVVHEVSERRLNEIAGGAAWHLGNRAAIGVEAHVWTDELEQIVSGEGPNAKGMDVRAGIEYPCTPQFTGRAGYIWRTEDDDDLTENNEWKSQAITLGAGFQPPLARWRFESGYVFEWGQADFGSPARPRFTRQQIATQIKWAF
jgi:hypothetical protein